MQTPDSHPGDTPWGRGVKRVENRMGKSNAARLAFLCLFAAVATPAPASDTQMAAAFGNTVISRYPDGGWVKHWFDRDGGYSAEFSDGRRIRGSWRIEGERLCLNGITPSIMLIRRFCSPMVAVRQGETWASRDPLGRRVQNQLLQGR